jgi:hypothetical protein
MTSFTRALYRRDPAAAEAFYKDQQFEQRLVYGKQPTLACFTPAANGLARRAAPSQPRYGKGAPAPFGKREIAPQGSDCPHDQSFCRDNGLMQANCSACKGLHVERQARQDVDRMASDLERREMAARRKAFFDE